MANPQHRQIGNGRGAGVLLKISTKVFSIHPNRRRHIAQRNFSVEVSLDIVNHLTDGHGRQGR